MEKIKKLFVLGFILTGLNASASGNDYCIALRGNGQQMPSHFGALAKTIETFGIPQGMAGGSSASISTFLMESILENPLIKGQKDSEKQKLNAAFLWKSLEGVLTIMKDEPQWKALASFLTDMQQTKEAARLMESVDQSSAKVLLRTLTNVPDIENALSDLKNTGVFNGPAIQNFLTELNAYRSHPSDSQQTRVALAFSQAKSALAVFGKFDAQNDQGIFLRSGVVDFHALARLFGRLGDFLAMNAASIKTKHEMDSWLKACGEKNFGKNWAEITEHQPACLTRLANLKTTYFNEVVGNTKYNSRINQTIGRHFSSFAITSILVGNTAASFSKAKTAYDDSYGQNLINPRVWKEEVKFGYWGNSKALARAGRALQDPSNDFSTIDKSMRFKNLGEDTWENILSLSPAEPGLGSIQNYTILSSQEKVISAGGWADLHPMLMLKASGCKQVVYVSRRGGESDFVAGVGKRLFGFDKMSWTLFDASNTETFKGVSDRGSDYLRENNLPIDPQWQKMLDMKYSRSSFNYSLQQANAVVCTNWSDFDVVKQIQEIIRDGYEAPIYISKELPLQTDGNFKTLKNGDQNSIGCVPIE